jgi:YidC/Oxa1 family membrane protein insertase
MRRLLIILIQAYRYLLSSLLGNNCRYTPTCSQYALEAIEMHGSAKGLWLALKRVSSCHPWHVGGYDLSMDNTRLFLFAALVFVGMLLWQQWQADYGPQPVSSSEVEVSTDGGVASSQIPTDDLPDQAEQVLIDNGQGTPQAGDSSGVQSAAQLQVQQLVQVDTDVLRLMIDTRGGVIRSLKLKQYPTSLEQPDDWLELIHSDSDSVYIVQSGLRNKAERAPTHHSIYRSEQTSYQLADGDEELLVPMYWNQDGLEVVKTYRFRRGDYLIGVEHRIDNQSAHACSIPIRARFISTKRPSTKKSILMTWKRTSSSCSPRVGGSR